MRTPKGHIRIAHPLKGEYHIFSVKVARGFKPGCVMRFHAMSQMEGIDPSILRIVNAVEQLTRIKSHRTGFGTVNQLLVRQCGTDGIQYACCQCNCNEGPKRSFQRQHPDTSKWLLPSSSSVILRN